MLPSDDVSSEPTHDPHHSPHLQTHLLNAALRPGITFHFLPTHISTAHGGRSASSLSSASDAAVGTGSGREGGRALFVVGLSLGRCRRCRRRDRERDGEETAGVGPRPRRSKLLPREDCGIGGRPFTRVQEVRLTLFVLFSHNHFLTKIDHSSVPRTGRRL